MSTTIADGYRIRLRTGGAVNPFEFAALAKPALQAAIHAEYIPLVTRTAALGHDWLRTQDQPLPLFGRLARQVEGATGRHTGSAPVRPESDRLLHEDRNAWRWAEALLHAHYVAQQYPGIFDADHDLRATMWLWADPDDPDTVYMRVPCYRDSYRRAILDLADGPGSRFLVEKYNYWNGTDETEDGLTWEQWTARGEVWKKVTDPRLPPLQVTLTEPHLGYRGPRIADEEIEAAAPTLEQRAEALAWEIPVECDLELTTDANGYPDNIFEVAAQQKAAKKDLVPALITQLSTLGPLTGEALRQVPGN